MIVVRVCVGTLLMAAVSGYGQEYRATLLGLISDVTGATVAGAKVLVVNTETEVRSTSAKNDLYSLDGRKARQPRRVSQSGPRRASKPRLWSV